MFDCGCHDNDTCDALNMAFFVYSPSKPTTAQKNNGAFKNLFPTLLHFLQESLLIRLLIPISRLVIPDPGAVIPDPTPLIPDPTYDPVNGIAYLRTAKVSTVSQENNFSHRSK